MGRDLPAVPALVREVGVGCRLLMLVRRSFHLFSPDKSQYYSGEQHLLILRFLYQAVSDQYCSEKVEEGYGDPALGAATDHMGAC